MVTKIGLDLGYANITLSDVSSGVYREPSVALINKATRQVISVGTAAMNNDVEDGTMLVRPFKNGLLFDNQITRGVIENALNAVKPAEKIRCVIGVSANFLPKQEKEIFEMLNTAGAEECFSVTKSVAAIIGAGYSPAISAISVNIGAKMTEVAVLYKGKPIITKVENIGGEDFDIAVKQHILERGDVNISLSVARSIKEYLGAVWSGRETQPIDIEGTLSLTGSRVRMSVSAEDVVGVFEEPLLKLITVLTDAIKQIPYEYVEEIFENGIILSGGGAELYGLDMMINKVVGVSVTKPKSAIDCVARGLSRINSFIPMRMRSNNKNITSQLSKYYESKKTTKQKSEA